MAVHKEVSSLAYLLVLGLMFLLVSAVKHVDAKACTRECGNLGYGICPRSEGSPPNPICTNCCAGYKGCNYYSADGTFICEGESDPKNPKACPRNCDGRIAYSKCPRSKGSPENPICTNCCAGYKGCYYYSADGTFICEGESDPKNPKACPRNCDGRIAYSKCPRSKGKTIIYPTGCTTCCTGRKGCYYFDQDGKFVCEGESDEPQSYISAA